MRLEGKVEKTWGYEDIIITNDLYCLKYLVFKNKSKSSMHFHMNKHETWKVVVGSFQVHVLDMKDCSITTHVLNTGDTWINEPMKAHQLESLEDDSIIMEVSTSDSIEDNYKVWR